MRLRRAVWDRYRVAGLQRPVRVRWHDGLRLDLVLGNDQSRCLYVGGSYEPNELAFLARVLRPGMQVVDVGANEGFYTVFAARRVAPGGRVLAFEPSPRERSRLERNVRINRLANVQVLPLALGARPGRAVLRVANPEHNGQNSLGAFAYESVSLAGEVNVEVRTLDEVAAGTRVDLVKIDVEGAELAVLEGAERVLREERPLVQLEIFDAALRGQGAGAPALLAHVKDRRYELLAFTASGQPEVLQGAPEDGTNVVAVPEEKLASVLAAAGPTGGAAAR